MSLMPKLTTLDERVLAQLGDGRAHRLQEIAEGSYPAVVRRWHPRLKRITVPNDLRDEVLGILRGLAHLGLVRERRGGWWSLP